MKLQHARAFTSTIVAIACCFASDLQAAQRISNHGCGLIVDSIANGFKPYGANYGDLTEASSKEGISIVRKHKSYAENFGIPHTLIFFDAEKADCIKASCNATLFSYSHGFAFASGPFLIDKKTTINLNEWFGPSPFRIFGQLPKSEVKVLQISGNKTETTTLYYGKEIPIGEPKRWLRQGVPAIPLFLFNQTKTRTDQGC